LDELATEAARVWDRILAVGVLDPGLWYQAADGLIGYLSLSDAARLADLSGLSVVDAFAARDLALDGAGGPLTALPYWIALRHAQKPRLLVEFADQTRITYLPAAREPDGADQVMQWRLARGLHWLERLSHALNSIRVAADSCPDAQLIPELQALWQSEQPAEMEMAEAETGVWASTRKELAPALLLIQEKAWPASSVLQTAVHCVAQSVVALVADYVLQQSKQPQLVVTGGGPLAAMLRQQLIESLPGIAVASDHELGFPGEMLPSVAAALLAQLNFDQTPANLTHLTAARTPRVLGRLTPGSPRNWQRLVRHLAEQKPAVVSLRAAM
jgi:anhydro-N-acetylmuramic acid kinase